MKRTMIGALVAAQIAAVAQPASAAELPGESSLGGQQRGTFAGARLRIPLGAEGASRVRAGLTVAPVVRDRQSDGSLRTRFGSGLELGFAGSDRIQMSFAGTPLSRFAQGGSGPAGRKAGVSTLGWVGIGVATVAVVVIGAYALCASETICNFDDE
jgi:hypothetical protein